MDAATLRSLIRYDPDTGVFVWLVTRARGARAGGMAGSLDKRGYRNIKVCGRRHFAHRLAFLYMTGRHPVRQIDHKNTVHDDNRWDNLREAGPSENTHNRPAQSNNASGFKGVSKKRSRWRAVIRHKGKQQFLGVFETPEQAHAAYVIAAKSIYGEFAKW